MSRAPHPPWFNHPNNIRWRLPVLAQITFLAKGYDTSTHPTANVRCPYGISWFLSL
jgi:hypothetical protein